MSVVGSFLGGIAAVIWDPEQGYLLLRRSSEKDFAAGEWECITGRVDQGESYTQALHREVMEEIGCRVQIEFLIGTTHFYRGSAIPENELLGVIFGCTLLDGCAPEFGVEHTEMVWARPEQLNDLVPHHSWLRQVIRQCEQLRSCLSSDLRRRLARSEFEF